MFINISRVPACRNSLPGYSNRFSLSSPSLAVSPSKLSRGVSILSLFPRPAVLGALRLAEAFEKSRITGSASSRTLNKL